MATSVQTVSGTCRAADLGRTLMHEHLLIGWPGWETDATAPRFDRREAKRMCVDRMLELKALSASRRWSTPPHRSRRDVEFAAEGAQGRACRSRHRPLKEESGAAPCYKFRAASAVRRAR